MTISIASGTSAVQTNTDSAHGLLVAKKARSQQELEGQMALELIQSAGTAANASLPTPTATSGMNVNIKV